jgi:signal transduction histidine kinase
MKRIANWFKTIGKGKPRTTPQQITLYIYMSFILALLSAVTFLTFVSPAPSQVGTEGAPSIKIIMLILLMVVVGLWYLARKGYYEVPAVLLIMLVSVYDIWLFATFGLISLQGVAIYLLYIIFIVGMVPQAPYSRFEWIYHAMLVGGLGLIVFGIITYQTVNNIDLPPLDMSYEIWLKLVPIVAALVFVGMYAFLNNQIQLKKQAEEEKQRADAEAEKARLAEQAAREADRLKSEFLANMSHELRTPLNAMIGFTDIQIYKMFPQDATPEQLEALKTDLLMKVRTNAAKLLGLINEVLDLAKIEAGQVSFHYTSIALRQTVEEVLATGQGFILEKKKNVTLQSKYAQDVPAEVIADQKRLSQVLTNLISNAIKFTEGGEVVVDVWMPHHDNYAISVSDNGMGIPADANGRIDYVFDKFRQADGTDAREQQGTGLGLTITKELTEKMGGTISVKSVVGQGSTFTVTLPVHPVDISTEKSK